ncbi:hypothetical protein FNV43_RR21742 [Rhamnella rubrinervis]|uniref:Aminotransferase-like plant mobile domain-containing protein n=1 Tax=Rhamnella rubrinervis TaxID=2594499 RepID=A0A8K0DNX9_9ROSA|nr:hypothetical protein FNV43_RR21742 [Rhamnella rubrinervis]
MTPTLINIEAYTGLTSSDTLLTDLPSSSVSSSIPGFHKDAKNYGQFLRMNKGTGSPPSEDEHIAFLLMWLCKNIFCVLASKITLHFINIAKSLATGKPISLGLLVLAHLYRAIALISAEPYEMNLNVPRPLWILRMWLHAHFHESRPQHVYHRSLLSRLYNSSSFFAIPSDIPHGDALKHFLIKKFHSVMACRDLPYCGISNKKSQCSVEVYLPSFIARQFGMYQVIPLPPASSFNGLTSVRPIIKNESEFHQYTHLYKESQGLFELEVSIESANSTFHFDLWWNRKTCTYFMNTASDMVSHVFLSTEIITKYVKPSYEMTSISIIPANRTITCSNDHNAASALTDSGSDSNDDTATISQAIKKRRTTTSNTAGPRVILPGQTFPPRNIKRKGKSGTTFFPKGDRHAPTTHTNITSQSSLAKQLSDQSESETTDASHEIDPQPVVTIVPSLAETKMPFNSHLIIEDITEAEGNSDVDDFLIDHDPAQNSNCELALTNNFESTISKFLHSLDEKLATFNKFRENIFDATSHCSSMISLQTSIQSKALEYTTASAKLTAQEHVVKELKAKLAEAEDVCGNLRCSIQHTIDEAEKEKKQYIDLLKASKNRNEARIQAEEAITAHHAS